MLDIRHITQKWLRSGAIFFAIQHYTVQRWDWYFIRFMMAGGAANYFVHLLLGIERDAWWRGCDLVDGSDSGGRMLWRLWSRWLKIVVANNGGEWINLGFDVQWKIRGLVWHYIKKFGETWAYIYQLYIIIS